MEKTYLEKINAASEFLKERFKDIPEIAIILGSGLGVLSDEIEEKKQRKRANRRIIQKVKTENEK